jgi:transposase InsO family protein
MDFDAEGERCLNILVGSTIPVALKMEEITDEVARDVEMQALSRSLQSGEWGEKTHSFGPFQNELSQVGNLILRGNKLVIPRALRERVLQLAHEGHPGVVAFKQRLRGKVWWPGIDKNATTYVKSCHGCQLVSKGDPPEPLQRSELPTEPWEDIAIDFMGPLPSGHYLLVTVDYYSRYYEVDIMKSITAAKTIERLKVIFARFGLPSSIRCDNGPQFISEEFKEFCQCNNIRIRYSTPLWPQANGEVERQNRSLLKRLRIAQQTKTDWKEELLAYLSCYRSTPHSTTGVSPGEVMFNRRMREKIPSFGQAKPGDMDLEMRDRDKIAKFRGKEYADNFRHAQESALKPGDVVLMRQEKTSKLTTPFHPTPCKVVNKSGSSVTVETPTGKQFTRNSTHIKKYTPRSCIRDPEEREVTGGMQDPAETRLLEPPSMSSDTSEMPGAPSPRTRPKREIKLPSRFRK